MDLLTVFKQGDAILITVFLLLIFMSVLTWVIIIIRFTHNFKMRKANKIVLEKIWQAPNESAFQQLISNNDAPIAQIAVHAFKAQKNYQQHKNTFLGDGFTKDEFLVRAIRQGLTDQTSRFDNGLTALASVGATAPFIGLFGTVWGIYHALVNIGTTGQMSIAAVAGPIGEALVATAAGLATAIPAVLAYNALMRNNKTLTRELDHFAYDLHAKLMISEQKNKTENTTH